jgi:hypothetical protein
LTLTISALVATAAAASGIALGSPGAARPAFAPAYVGTAQGTLRMPGRTDTWTVQGLTFKLQNARLARGRWGGTYLVTGGRVTFTSKATGECKSSTTASFSLGRMTWDKGSILFLQNLREPGYDYLARVTKEHPVKVTQQCNDRGETYTNQEVVSTAGGLWLLTDIGERIFPGRRLSGSHREQSYDGTGTRTWTWNLAPRR